MSDYIYAVFSGDKVANIVVAEDGSSSEVLMLMLGASAVVLVDDQTGPAFIGGDAVGGRFRPPPPYSSWEEWDEEAWAWQPPTPASSVFHFWDEDSRSWVLGPPPFPSWVWVEETNAYVAPIPRLKDTEEVFHTWDEEGQRWVQVIIEEAEADPLP